MGVHVCVCVPFPKDLLVKSPLKEEEIQVYSYNLAAFFSSWNYNIRLETEVAVGY